MCFSAAASYTASAVLLLSGIIALSKAKARTRMFAAIPLIFAIQQFTEGVTWQTLQAGGSALISTYAYLFFVFIIWPLLVPWAALSLSTSTRERKLLRLPLAAGGVVALLALVSALYITPITVITCNSIRYTADLPLAMGALGTIAYLIATIGPFFIVQQRHFWLMGSALTIAYLMSFIFYYQTLISVWCFFAALLSVLTLLMVW